MIRKTFNYTFLTFVSVIAFVAMHYPQAISFANSNYLWHGTEWIHEGAVIPARQMADNFEFLYNRTRPIDVVNEFMNRCKMDIEMIKCEGDDVYSPSEAEIDDCNRAKQQCDYVRRNQHLKQNYDNQLYDLNWVCDVNLRDKCPWEYEQGGITPLSRTQLAGAGKGGRGHGGFTYRFKTKLIFKCRTDSGSIREKESVSKCQTINTANPYGRYGKK